jgi:hypothetical protein
LTEDDGTQFCFRCKGMAVVDKSLFKYLPSVLNRAAFLLGDNLVYTDEEEVWNLKRSLREYAIMVEGMPDN